MPWTRYLVFVSVVTAIAGLLHAYLWWRLVAAPAWPAPWYRIATISLIVLCLTVPLSFVASHVLPKAIGVPLVWVGYVWMGLMFLLLALAVMGEPVRIIAQVTSWISPAAMSDGRRTFLLRALAAIAMAGAAVTGTYGVFSALATIRVRRVPVRIRRLGQGLAGLKVAQISDIHIGPTLGRDFLQGIVDRVNALEPDIIAITGDLVDGSVEELGGAVRVLEQLRAKHGVYFVTGNHEYYSGVEEWAAFLKTLGIRVLRNERVAIDRDGSGLDLLGVDDWSSRRHGGNGASLQKAMDGRDRERPTLLLAHQPKAFPEAAEHDIDLQLSGHTHGGQIKPFHLFTRLDTPYVRGLYSKNGSQLYVSPGTGFWGPPMRVGVPAEITLIELQPA